MTDRAITKETMLQGLQDIHLPNHAAGGMLAELFAAVALCGAIALLGYTLLQMVSVSANRERPKTLADKLADLRKLEDPDRRIALLHLLKVEKPDHFAALKQSLYKPNSMIETAHLETVLLDEP